MPGVTPLTGLMGTTGYVNENPEASPEQVHGGYVDAAHSNWGEQAQPYPWQRPQDGMQTHGPYGPQNGLLGDESQATAAFAAGVITDDPTGDRNPYGPGQHAAPWPKNPMGDQSVFPDNVANQRLQSASIHASDLGASDKHLYEPTLFANNDEWTDFYTVDHGTSLQPQGVPQSVGIVVGGWGSTDRVNSHAHQNSYGFDSVHMHRRYATGSVPGNYMWMKPGSRPMVRSNTGLRNFPTGQDSPFEGDDTTSAYGIEGAILSTPPTEYVAPPQPVTTPAFDPSNAGGTMETGWMGW